MRVSLVDIKKTSMEALSLLGVPEKQAEIITNTIIYAHMHEKHTHGISRMSIYEKKIRNGWMSANTRLETCISTPGITVLDAHDGFGQVAALEAMRLAVEKARQTGIAATFVRNSNNFGVAGYFGNYAAEQRMIGIVYTSSAPAIAPEGGVRPIFGTNPMCYAFPNEPANIILDMAVSAAARGKVRLAAQLGETIPFGWAVDAEGKPTNDPTEALKGNMLAIGGVKGFGLAMVCDLLAGMMSGSAFGGDIKPLGTEDGQSRHGHMTVAIDIEQLMPYDTYRKKMAEFVNKVKACGQSGAIQLPGENSFNKALKNHVSVEIADKQVEAYNNWLKQMGCHGQLQ